MVRCLFLLVIFTGIADSVPHDFCFDAFDGRDCGRAPVPVFYYYKPGSRCEIREWRGCETRNMFPDQVVCNTYCIWNSSAAVDELPPEPEPEITQEEFVNELKELKLEVIEEIADILEDVISTPIDIETDMTEESESVEDKGETTTEVETEAETEAQTEEQTATEAQTETVTETEPPETIEDSGGNPEEVILT